MVKGQVPRVGHVVERDTSAETARVLGARYKHVKQFEGSESREPLITYLKIMPTTHSCSSSNWHTHTHCTRVVSHIQSAASNVQHARKRMLCGILWSGR